MYAISVQLLCWGNKRMRTFKFRYIIGCLIFSQQLYATPAVLLEHSALTDEISPNTISGNYAHQVSLNILGRSRITPVRFPTKNTAIVNVSYEKINTDKVVFDQSIKAIPTTQQPTVIPAAVTTQNRSAALEVPENNRGSTHTIGAPRKAQDKHWPHSVSLGKPYRGWLYNPVKLKSNARIHVRRHKNYATAEMVNAITHAVDTVHETFTQTPRLPIGNLSRKAGGRFPPHKSHQNGRDADIAYYLRIGHHPLHLKVATKHTLDVARTWVFLETMIKRGEIQVAFIDYRLQGPLYRYATQERGWTAEQMKTIMSYPRGRGDRKAIIRHLRGHHDHMHVRFHAPDSVAAVDELIARYGRKILKPVPVYTRIRSGDSLWKLARRHKATVSKLRRWNGRKRTRVLRVGRRLITGWRRPSISELKGSS
jgi:hypothetical protein